MKGGGKSPLTPRAAPWLRARRSRPTTHGEVNFGEKVPKTDVLITLDGIPEDRLEPVHKEFLITGDENGDYDGIYMFFELRPGEYTVTETQPAGLLDGKDTPGTINDRPVPLGPGDPDPKPDNDTFLVTLSPRPELAPPLLLPLVAENFNFGARPPENGDVTPEQTATIGFWQNKHGQDLISLVNDDTHQMQLGNWLAATFPNMYGNDGVDGVANPNNLAGLTNDEVADFYSELFRRKKKEAVKLGLTGPVKMDAQILATAFACYVTNETLAGTIAGDYGGVVRSEAMLPLRPLNDWVAGRRYVARLCLILAPA